MIMCCIEVALYMCINSPLLTTQRGLVTDDSCLSSTAMMAVNRLNITSPLAPEGSRFFPFHPTRIKISLLYDWFNNKYLCKLARHLKTPIVSDLFLSRTHQHPKAPNDTHFRTALTRRSFQDVQSG